MLKKIYRSKNTLTYQGPFYYHGSTLSLEKISKKHPLWNVWWNYLLLPKLQRYIRLFMTKISPAIYMDWGPPYLSPVVRYILHLIIALACRNWWCKKCSKNCKDHVFDLKNTQHIESNYTLQPSKYLISIVNWFIYIKSVAICDRCTIPMHITIMLGPHQ